MMIAGATNSLFAADPASTTPVFTKLVVVGDSITKHGPAANLGWSGDWGMAASVEAKDYVHLIVARLTAAQNGQAPQLMVVGGGGGKLGDKVGLLPSVTAFGADLAIVQMGENDNVNISVDGFQVPYERILKAFLAGNPKVRIFCFGVWSGSSTKDELIQAACRDCGATFVSLNAANADPLNRAGAEHRFTNPGVNWHPGDKGMQAYADAFWTALTGQAPPPTPAAASTAPSVGSGEGTLFTEDWTGASGLDWNPAPKIISVDGHSVMSVALTEPNGRSFFNVSLPLEKIKGRTLRVETRIKGEAISPKPNQWNGIRIGLVLQNAEGQLNYPQLHVPDGTFDWTDATWSFDIPDNIVTAKLILGLENVTGTVDFDTVKISVQP